MVRRFYGAPNRNGRWFSDGAGPCPCEPVLPGDSSHARSELVAPRGGPDRDKGELGCASACRAGSDASRRGRMWPGVPKPRPTGKPRSTGGHEETRSSSPCHWPGSGKRVAAVRREHLPKCTWPPRARGHVRRSCANSPRLPRGARSGRKMICEADATIEDIETARWER